MHREIQSIEIISEFFLEPMQNTLGTFAPYVADNKLLCDNVKIVFTDGSIIETFLHVRRCWTHFNNCLGTYHFTGVITENGAENKCNKCTNVMIGPIYIDLEEIKIRITK
jgi:hypothetical protein